jgi:hypothetical protein
MQVQKIWSKVIVFTICCLSISPSLCHAQDSWSLNNRVLSFATNSIGRSINNGNCWVFPRDALFYAGGRFPGPRGSYRTTVFGRVVSLNELRPGDIIAFESATFASRGRIYARTGANHYAIVESVYRGQITMLHQNWAGKRYVIRGYCNPRDLVFGKIIYYRPQLK